MTDEPKPSELAQRFVDAIRAYLESMSLGPIAVSVDETDERIHIAGEGWDVYLAKTHFLNIRLPEDGSDE